MCSKVTIKKHHNGVDDVVLVFLIVNFEHISHLFPRVSIVDFEQVSVNWELMCLI